MSNRRAARRLAGLVALLLFVPAATVDAQSEPDVHAEARAPAEILVDDEGARAGEVVPAHGEALDRELGERAETEEIAAPVDETRLARARRLATNRARERERAARVQRIDDERVQTWARELPEFWRTRGPYGVLRVDWLLLVLLLPVAIAVAFAITFPMRLLLGRVRARMRPIAVDVLDRALAPSFKGLLAVSLFRFGADELSLPVRFDEKLTTFEHIAFVMLWLFAVARTLGVLGRHALHSEWAQQSPSSRSLVPVAMRAGNALVWIAAFLVVLSMLGFDIRALLTGLGVGGIIVALAAQKTVENVIGAFALGIDQPLREGETVNIGGITGTVERIGLRSTRLRTPERTVVFIPNARLADMNIESIAARDRVRLVSSLFLTYDTDVEALDALRKRLVADLNALEHTAERSATVRLKSLAERGIEVEVLGWFEARDSEEVALVRERMIETILTAVTGCGVKLSAAQPQSVIIQGSDARTSS